MEESLLSTRYDASLVESRWYQAWEDAGLFQPDPDPTKPRFTITIPPPNITGSLHMGHALCYPLQDVFGRYRRLSGDSVLVLPGQDHAGIATQSVVDKLLKKQGSSAAKIGREAFIERVWEWRRESGDTILRQLRSLGCAFDWSRQRFTLDDDYATAVLRVFIDWFERGIIFRGKRVVNWDPVLQTSVSDIETERRLVNGSLYYVRYPFTDGSGDVVIATTRPETMLADVAVAVHPSDQRYQGLVGKMLRLPLVGREIPLIADIYPDPEFGSGAVKITPAHDPNDFEVGRRHGLPMPVLLDARARVTEEGGPYAGMDRLEARKAIVQDLEAQGFLVEVKPHEIPILVSERSGEPIEPLLSEQWFADQKALAGPGIEAVRDGRIRLSPERYNRIFLDWMENIREWCVSRQLWWGHRIPVYYTESGRAVAALSWDEAESKAGNEKIVRQDDDVLDTWFSSGLWPFATLGWPAETDDLKERYPTQLLITDRNIINLWVARMIMMGMDQVGDIPYPKVFVYATVLTEDGRRMSKSLGTGVDPMTVIETKGADALRWTLMSQTGENQDIRYSEKRTEEARNFANKIWNASRFILMNLEGYDANAKWVPTEQADLWILSRLASTEKTVREGYEHYHLQSVCAVLHRFFWSELCDWYIEISKPRLADPTQRAVPQAILLACLEAFLTMLHPIMPHVTEEIYQRLPLSDKAPFLMAAPWPSIANDWNHPQAEEAMEHSIEVTRALRALRAELNIDPMKPVERAFVAGSPSVALDIVQSQGWFNQVVNERPGPETPALSTTVGATEVYVPIEGEVDLSQIFARIDKEEASLRQELDRVRQKLSNPNFTERAKPEVVAKEREAESHALASIQALEERRALLVRAMDQRDTTTS